MRPRPPWPRPQQHSGAAQADNQRVQALHDYTTVQAPIAGVVVWRYADTGALIQGGTNSNNQDLPIVRLSQSTLLRLRVPVPESDIRYVHEGDELTVRVDAINRSFTGKIVRFTRDVNFETRTMETEIDVENKDLSISPGHVCQHHASPGARRECGHHSHRGPGAEWPATNGLCARRLQSRPHPARPGWHRGIKLAEIKSGLKPGDRVIVGGQDKYQEGEEVSPELENTQASETVQETGGMIDLKGDENIAGEAGALKPPNRARAWRSPDREEQTNLRTAMRRIEAQNPGGAH